MARGCSDIRGIPAADQYCEVLPGADGRGIEGESGPRLREVLPADVVKRLERSGPLGQALLAIPSGTSPDVLSGERRPLDVRDLVNEERLGPESGSPSARVLRAVRSSGTADGGVFGVVLFGSAVTLVGAAWLRRRTFLAS
jgi:hypothetical protein